MLRDLIVFLLAIGWCSAAALIPPEQEIKIDQTKQKEESNEPVYPISQTGNQQQQAYAQGNQQLASQYFYPTYPDYSNREFLLKSGYGGYLVPAVLLPQKEESNWLTDIATTLLPFSNDVLLHGARVGAHLLHFIFVILMGGAVTTMICTFTPFCSINFLGFGLTKNQVKEQITELARAYVSPENINAATILVLHAVEKYTAMQREKQETTYQKEKSGRLSRR
ncbi:uncharacterized protein LOC122405074 [Colletes gigas]|uniref:uncharacterized protein LOC122405074 n=1 Tax=Colletes gigas TaxID=935657 RepID=UPI001C9B0F02|nr:uncharacterized protein LOC122405074 [Colletes gigas]